MSTSGGDRAVFFAPIGAITERLAIRLEHDRTVAVGAESRGAFRLVALDDLLGGVSAPRAERNDGADEVVAVRARAAVARRLEDRARERGPVSDEALFLFHLEIAGE